MRTRTLILVAAALAALSGVASANNIAYNQTWYNTDYASTGCGDLRGTGVGTMALGGVSGTVQHAFLYWHGPTNSADPNANANVLFNGNNITGTNIGISQDNNWGYLNSQAYRADVTAFVTGNGNFSVGGMATDPTVVNANGASLLVSFDDGNATNNRDVVLFDGNDSNIHNLYDADGWNVSLNGINYSGGTASIELGVSDGQEFLDDALLLNGNTLAAAGPIFQGSLHGGTGGVSNGSLWDDKSFDIAPYLSLGNNNISMTTGSYQDALSMVYAAIVLPTGAAPTTTPEPGSLALVALGMAGLLVARKFKG